MWSICVAKVEISFPINLFNRCAFLLAETTFVLRAYSRHYFLCFCPTNALTPSLFLVRSGSLSLLPLWRPLRQALFLSATLRRSHPPPSFVLLLSAPLDRAPLPPCPMVDLFVATSLNWLTEQVETKVRCLHLYYNPLFPCLVLMHRIPATWPAPSSSSLASSPAPVVPLALSLWRFIPLTFIGPVFVSAVRRCLCPFSLLLLDLRLSTFCDTRCFLSLNKTRCNVRAHLLTCDSTLISYKVANRRTSRRFYASWNGYRGTSGDEVRFSKLVQGVWIGAIFKHYTASLL